MVTSYGKFRRIKFLQLCEPNYKSRDVLHKSIMITPLVKAEVSI